jgi:hypothetical protein
VLLQTASSHAEPSFSTFDVPTVFFINKSDDKNRVDYGMRLDEQCRPRSDEAVFPYWREFEQAPPVRTHPLKSIEYMAYGISAQKRVRSTADGAEYLVRLKQLDRPVVIFTRKGANGGCEATARTTIANVDRAELRSVFVRLGGLLSVRYVEITGRDPRTGGPLTEHIDNK